MSDGFESANGVPPGRVRGGAHGGFALLPLAGFGARLRPFASEAELAEGARMLREGNRTAFVVLKVKPDDPPSYKRNLDPASCRERFRGSLLGLR